ncbi:hypothetical protein JXL21_02565 [Candidatus Bathyarchaeota archaeon]|nr:hypothetical protein [Candidatus Bathyarchaeota archaeon]
MSPIDLKDIERKTYRESMKDGLTEMMMGAGFLIISLVWWFTPLIVFYVLWLPYFNKTVEKLRERYTYPRVGYVKVFEESEDIGKGIFGYMVAVFVVMGVGVYLVYGEITSGLIYRWLPTFMGLMVLGAMVYMEGKTGDRRFWVYAAVSVCIGLAFSWVNALEWRTAISLQMILIGLVVFISGSVRFYLFLREYPIIEGGTDE